MQELLGALRAAGEHTRLRILGALRENELTVSELVKVLDQSQPRVSRHLKLLCDSGLLERDQDGAWVFHRLAEDGEAGKIVRGLMALLDQDAPELVQDRKRLQEIKQVIADQAEAYFKENALEWDRIRQLTVADEEIEKRMLEALKLNGDETLLDIGTGTGRILTLLADSIGHGIGIDQSREMLEVARANLAQHNITNCLCKRADARSLPLPSNSVNIVVIHQVLHYLDQPEAVIREAARVLQPGGQLLVVDFLPHDQEFLRQQHAHRRLGFSHQIVQQWCKNNDLALTGCDILGHDRQSGESITIGLWKIRAKSDSF